MQINLIREKWFTDRSERVIYISLVVFTPHVKVVFGLATINLEILS